MIQPDNQPSISTVTRSPELEADAVEVVVTVPTFRRPAQILETLASLQRQQTTRRFAVILIENEAEKREGAIAATPLFESGAIEGMIIVAHERGNCCAYNAGLETALANFPNFSWLAIIDDDEIADPQWLEQLCATGENFRRRYRRRPADSDLPGKQRPAGSPTIRSSRRTTGRAVRSTRSIPPAIC